MTPTPYFLAAKKAGMPSTMGEDPRISNNAVRAVVLYLCACNGGDATTSGVTGCADAAS